MYHFIRRFFVLFLALAFGFTFLLCCFVHTGWCQGGLFGGFLGLYGADGMGYGVWYGYQLSGIGSYAASPEMARAQQLQSVINSYERSDVMPGVHYDYLLDYRPASFSGSSSSLMDRTGFALGTRNQQYIPNMTSQSYIPGVVTGAYGFPNAGTVNYAHMSTYSEERNWNPYTLGVSPGGSNLYLPYGIPKSYRPQPSDYGYGGWGSELDGLGMGWMMQSMDIGGPFYERPDY